MINKVKESAVKILFHKVTALISAVTFVGGFVVFVIQANDLVARKTDIEELKVLIENQSSEYDEKLKFIIRDIEYSSNKERLHDLNNQINSIISGYGSEDKIPEFIKDNYYRLVQERDEIQKRINIHLYRRDNK